MTLSDPLLKELKGHIGTLILSGPGPYTDDDEAVFLICHSLESVFLKGLIRHDGFTPWRTDCFQWFHQLVRKYNRVLPLTFRGAFDDIMNDRKTKTNAGKTRLLIRHCLKRKCLHVPLQFHIDNHDYMDRTLRVNYNPNSSVLGHEILSQIFLSLLLQLSNYEFQFDLTNSSFLDESWQIPKLFKTELVPCDKLGLTLGFPMGYAVVVNILEHSVAAEYKNKIEVGDILDEFNDVPVRHFYGSKIESLFKKCRKKPFKISFIKSKDPETSQIFLPAIKLYRVLGMDPELLNYPEPAYRRNAINNPGRDEICSLSLSEDEQILNCDMQANGNEGVSNTDDEPLISVEVEVESHERESTSQTKEISSTNTNGGATANSSYLDLLSSIVESSSSTLDLLSSDMTLGGTPDLMSADLPAQLILESNDNEEIGSHLLQSTNEKKTVRSGHSENSPLKNSSSKPCQYYDDSHPFMV